MKTIVMTGGTAGLGQLAAAAMQRAGDVRLLMGARRSGSGAASDGAELLALDLSKLASVRSFANAVSEKLGATPIDLLALNAGLQIPNVDQRTEDGFESNFAVNHLAHYLLLRLLTPSLASEATVVITTSDTHDPKRVPFGPKSLDLELSAHPKNAKPSGFMDGMRAYASSKLCNLLTARELARTSSTSGKKLRVIAYNPGLTAGTSLYRDAPFFLRTAVAMAKLFGQANPVELAGSTLAELALGRVQIPEGRVYASLEKRKLTWPEPSELAQSDALATSVWNESAKMVGLG